MANPIPGDSPLSMTGREAARLTGVCEKTLKRASDRGEPVGRFRVGTAVRYHRAALVKWLDAHAAPHTAD